MAEENAPETEAVTPKPRAPRKPRKTAAQKAAEAAEAERLAKEAEAETAVSAAVEEPVEAPVSAEEPVANPVEETPIVNSKEPLVEEVPVTVATAETREDEVQHGGIDELRAMFDAVDPEPEPEPVVHPLSVRGVILAPGYWQGFEGPAGRINVFAWLGLIFAFVFWPLGFLFSLLGLKNSKHVPNDAIGRVVGWIGFAISGIAAFLTLVWLILLPFNLLLGLPYMR